LISNGISTRKIVLLLLLILAVGSFLRIYDLGAESLWLDEAATINEVAMSVPEIAEHSNQPPLYLLILRFWIYLFGTSEVALRFPSVIFGVISIVLVYLVGGSLFNKRVGLVAGLLAAMSCFYIHYSQEARSYSLLLLLSLLSYLFFVKILQGDRKWYYAAYFLATLLLGYTHIYGLLLIPSQLLFFLLFWKKYRPQRIKFAVTVAVTILALLPLIPLMGGRVVSIAQEGFWIVTPGLGSIMYTLVAFTGYDVGRAFIPVAFVFSAFLLLAIAGFFSLKIAGGQWHWRKPLRKLGSLDWDIKPAPIEPGVLLLIWLFFSIVVPFIASQFMTPLYLTRYMIGASPAFYLMVARGVGHLDRKRLFYPVLAIIVVLSSVGLYYFYKDNVKPQWREAAALVEQNSLSNDTIIFCTGFCRTPFNYYYQGELTESGIGKYEEDRRVIAGLVDEAVYGKDRLWLVMCRGGQGAPAAFYLVHRYGKESILMEEEFDGVLVLLFDLPPP
jgi:mannosyltransferase